MQWNDGTTKQLNGLFDRLSRNLSPKTLEIAKSVIDEAAREFENSIRDGIPMSALGGGGLRDSFAIYQVADKGPDWYGYRAEFEGEAPNGESYQKIANVLNYGRKAYRGKQHGWAGTHFINIAVSQLSGLTDNINRNIDEAIAEELKEGFNGN